MSWYTRFDWITFLSWLLLSLIGLVAIYSATQGPLHQGTPIEGNFHRQILHLALGLGIIIGMMLLAPRFFIQLSYLLYGLCLIIAVLTIFFGIEVGGERNWLNVLGFRLQISEFMKVATILALASYLTTRRNVSARDYKTVATILVMIGLPVFTIFMHGDTGTMLVYLGLVPFVLFWSGLPYGVSLMLVAPAVVAYLTIMNLYAAAASIVLLTGGIFILEKRPGLTVAGFMLMLLMGVAVHFALSEVLEPHQRARVESFTNPSIDPHGAGWNVIQAKTAIASGGLYGKGFMEGTQTQLRFLPEQQTDFIFCVISEEFGLWGALTVLTLFMILLLRLLSNARHHKHPFAQFCLVGAASLFMVHIVVNLGMAMALLPVIGIPLPLISYGGSSFLNFSIMIGLCLNFHFYERDFSIYAS